MSRYLLDSQIFAWTLFQPERLKPAVMAALADPANDLFVSVVTPWELGLKAARGKFHASADWLPHLRAADTYRILPVDLDHVERSIALPMHHADPFDRILIAQALVEGLVLVSSDRIMRQYSLDILDAA